MASISQSLFFRTFGNGDAPAIPHDGPRSSMERRAILALCRSLRPASVIGFGDHTAGAAELLLGYCPFVTTYVGIDISHGTRTTLELRVVAEHESPRPLVREKVRLFKSPLAVGEGRLRPCDLGGPYGLAFLEGDLSYEGARRATELARAVVRPGGVICWRYYFPDSPDIGLTRCIDELNAAEGDRIIAIEGTSFCYEIRDAAVRQQAQPGRRACDGLTHDGPI